MMNLTYKPLKQLTILLFTGLLLAMANKMNAQDGQTYGKLSYNKAVNVAGKQRMLGQKLAKTYLYLLNNPGDAKAKREMMVSKLIFKKQNDILMTNANTELTKTRITAVNTLWSEYVKLFDGIPKKANAKRIILMNTDLLKASNDVVLAIIQEAAVAMGSEDELDMEGLSEDDSSLKHIINIAGRQRMLSQRLALYYFANNRNLKDKSTEITMKQVYFELDTALGTLLISEFNTDRIDEKLAIAMTKWETLKNDLNKLYNHEIPEAEIYKFSNSLTKAFNDVTALYEKVKI